jgi:two-component system, NarL family, response regulator
MCGVERKRAAVGEFYAEEFDCATMNANAPPIRLLVVDDHPIFRAGLLALVANEPDMRVVGEAADGREAIAAFQELRPDITLLDLQMPQMNGIDVIKTVRKDYPAARIIVLTTYAGDVLAQQALKAGAQAYVLKGLIRKELLDTIRAVAKGLKRISADVANQIAEHLGHESLTERELEVLRLVALGNSNRRIAVHLSITEETIKGHLKSILAKLGASDRTHAVTLALKRGIMVL